MCVCKLADKHETQKTKRHVKYAKEKCQKIKCIESALEKKISNFVPTLPGTTYAAASNMPWGKNKYSENRTVIIHVSHASGAT